MMEPQRLKDKYAGTFEGEVLGSARVDVPSGRARRRTLVTLGLATTATGLPVATTAAAGAKAVASVGIGVAVKWGTIGIAVGALTLGGIRTAPGWLGPRAARPALTMNRKVPALSPPSVEVTHKAEQKTPPTVVEENIGVEDGASRTPSVLAQRDLPHPASPRVEPALLETHLEEEVSLLDRARQALKTQPDRTLELIGDYLQRFPAGELRPEAMVLRIDALVRGKQRKVAEAFANDFLSRYPRSPHTKRIRALMGWDEESGIGSSVTGH
jgi:hypothetical protein